MALILAARHRARWVFAGACAALAAVTVISLGLGIRLRQLLPPNLVTWLVALLFLGFGIKLLLDAQAMTPGGGGDEQEEAEELVDQAEACQNVVGPRAVIWEAFSLVVLAEHGDRTQFATVFWPRRRPSPSWGCWPAPCWGMPW